MSGGHRPTQAAALNGAPAPSQPAAEDDVPAAWMTWLTTEHYNLQTQRAATIGEANGRSSVFLGGLSAGLIALGFQGAGHRSAGTTTFQVLVLSSLVVLGTITLLRCLQIAIDDRDFGERIRQLRAVYAELLPVLAARIGPTDGQEQAVVMLRPALARFQALLTVAGSPCVITAIVFGGDAGVLSYGLHTPLSAAIGVGAAAGLAFAVVGVHFQAARWHGADQARRTPIAPGERPQPPVTTSPDRYGRNQGLEDQPRPGRQ